MLLSNSRNGFGEMYENILANLAACDVVAGKALFCHKSSTTETRMYSFSRLTIHSEIALRLCCKPKARSFGELVGAQD